MCTLTPEKGRPRKVRHFLAGKEKKKVRRVTFSLGELKNRTSISERKKKKEDESTGAG